MNERTQNKMAGESLLPLLSPCYPRSNSGHKSQHLLLDTPLDMEVGRGEKMCRTLSSTSWATYLGMVPTRAGVGGNWQTSHPAKSQGHNNTKPGDGLSESQLVALLNPPSIRPDSTPLMAVGSSIRRNHV